MNEASKIDESDKTTTTDKTRHTKITETVARPGARSQRPTHLLNSVGRCRFLGVLANRHAGQGTRALRRAGAKSAPAREGRRTRLATPTTQTRLARPTRPTQSGRQRLPTSRRKHDERGLQERRARQDHHDRHAQEDQDGQDDENTKRAITSPNASSD